MGKGNLAEIKEEGEKAMAIDLDRWSAELMGWTYNVDEEGLIFYSDNNDPPQLPFIIYGWNPLTNANHLKMVIEKMRELGWYLNFDNYLRPGAFFYKDSGDWRHKIVNSKFQYHENNDLNTAVLQAAFRALKDD